MSGSIGRLSVELEVNDSGFTTRVTGAANALQVLQTNTQNTINVINRMPASTGSAALSIASWTTALGQATEALHFIREATVGWIEKIVESNAEIQRMTVLMQGLSDKASTALRLDDAKENIQQLITLSGQVPFSFSQLTDTFVKLRTAGIDPMKGSMQALTDAVAAFGGDDNRLQRAGYAIQEMAGRGTISLSNLRRQLGQDIPGAVQAMAQSMFLTIPQMDELITKGMLQSKGAIQLMNDELERLYGGAASQQINTYRGQINALQTSLQRLMLTAGGQDANGQNVGGGFFASLVEAMKQVNTMLQSNAATSFAVTLNITLTDLLEKVMSIGKAMIDWGNTIGKIVELLTALLIAKAVQSAIAGLATAVTSLGGGLLAGVTGLRNFGSVLIELIGAGPAVITWIGRLGASMYEAAASMAGVTVVAEGLEASLVGLGIGFATIAVPVAIIAGAGLIVSHLISMRQQADLTGDAMKRIRLGDVSEENERQTRKEINDLNEELDKLTKLSNAMEQVRQGQRRGVQLSDVPSMAGQPGISAPSSGFLGVFGSNDVMTQQNKDVAEIKNYGDALQRAIDEVRRQIGLAQKSVTEAPKARVQNEAQAYANEVKASVEQSYASSTVEYQLAIRSIDDARVKGVAANNPNAKSDADRAQIAAVTREYDARLQIIRDAMDREGKLLDDASKTRNQHDQADHAYAVAALRAQYSDMEQTKRDGLARLGQVPTDTNAKDAERALATAQTQIEHMREQIASMNAEIEGTGTTIAKVIAEIGGRANFNLLPPDIKTQLEDFARRTDTAKEKVEAFKAATRAEHTINMGLEKASADLAFYTAKLNDPSLPNAQRMFMENSARMGQSLAALATNLAHNATSLTTWKNTVIGIYDGIKAMQEQKQADALREVEEFSQRQKTALEAAMPARQRDAAHFADAKAEHDRAAALLRSSIADTDTLAKALARNDQALKDAQAVRDNRDAKIKDPGAGAAKQSYNQTTQLMERIAQLKAEITGVNEEEAKWTTLLERNGRAGSAAGEAQLALAKQYGELEKAAKQAHAAQTAMATLRTNSTAAEELRADTSMLDARSKLLPIERTLLEYHEKQAKAINAVSSRTPVAGVLSQGDIDRQATDARNIALKSETDERVAQLNIQLADYRSQTAKLHEEDGKTLADKIALGKQELQAERDKMLAIVSTTVQGDAAIDAANKTITDNYQARLDDLQRKNADALTKTMQSWGDWQTQIDNFGSQAFSKFGDELSTMLDGGKAKWTDFADWAIKQIGKIVLEYAAATASKDLGLTGGSSGGLGGIFSSLLGMFSGGGGSSGGTGTSLAVGNIFHDGGVAGEIGGITRAVSSSVWDDARRYHGGGVPGLSSDEVPAILQNSETVFTKSQTEAIGELNHNYAFVQSALQSVAQSASMMANNVPSNVAPQPYDPTDMAAAAPMGSNGANSMPISINLNNQTGTQATAVTSTPRFDGEKAILDVVLKAANQPGSFRTSLRGAVNS